MIGGIVETVTVLPDRVRVVCIDKSGRGDIGGTCVKISPQSLLISPGDSYWWQGRTVYWTPRPQDHIDPELLKSGCRSENGEWYDVELERVGYSF